jgi:adenylate kinase family enzyme
MKYYETTCTEYIAASKCVNMHPELEPIYAEMPSSLSDLGNIILYGPSGAGKYTQFLRFIEKYTVAGLKTEKMTAETEKQKYEYHISDIHYEIDLALLGCESKKLWNECFFQIVDVVSAKKSKSGIILCKNFQSIHSELLDVFYSYMQHCRALSIHIVFVLLTEHVSFIPNRILQCCKLISVKRPPAELYEQNISQDKTQTTITKSHKLFLQQIHPKLPYQKDRTAKCLEHISPESLLNMKEMHSIAKVASPPKDVFNIICDNIIDKIRNHETLDIISFRDNLYDILLYGLDVTECLWYILHYFVENEILIDTSGEVISEIMDKMNSFLKFYNNNYRPIYHLESMFIYLITKIYKYPTIENEQTKST